jgi:hypothetical protein
MFHGIKLKLFDKNMKTIYHLIKLAVVLFGGTNYEKFFWRA